MTTFSHIPINNHKEFASLVELLSYRAKHQADRKAYTFLRDGEVEDGSLTYAQLDEKARAIATYLQSRKAAGERVLLLYPPGLDFIAAFFGCLYANVVAVPVYPPKRNQNLSRLQAIATDAQAKVALTVSSTIELIQSKFAQVPEFADMQLLATDTVAISQASNWQPPEINPDTLAFLQYTSGSTGKPKGVMVSHHNLLQNSEYMRQVWQYDSSSVMVTWLPVFHDMGLIYGVFQPLYAGFPCYMMSPTSFIQKPLRWLQAISRYKATHSGAPNFAYELCVLKTTPADRANLDLSSWRMTLNGAEPVRASTLSKFTDAFKSSGFQLETFCPGYGLAEATLAIVAVPVKEAANYYSVQTAAIEKKKVAESTGKEKSQTFVSCGKPGIDTKIVIANPETLTQCAPQDIGEIWVSGSTVAQGYWQRPEETRETFGVYLEDTKEGPFLRTGDLGFFHNDELYIAGRIKDVIIIRGSNHYPQDIEQTVEESHPALRLGSGAAFSIDVDGTEQLVIVQEVERSYLRNLNSKEIIGAIRKAVSQKHYLQVYAVLLLKTATIPKTSSGKIQRSACRSGFLAQALDVVGEWIQESPQAVDLEQLQIESESSWDNIRDSTQQQKKSVTIVTQKSIQTWLIDYLSVNLHIPAKDIEITESFAYYGIDSNLATSIAYDLSEWLKCDLDPTLIWEYPTIESIAEYLESQHKQLETVA